MLSRELLTDLEVVREGLRLADETNPHAASVKIGVHHKTVVKWRERRELIGPEWPTDQDIAAHRAYRAATAAQREQVARAARNYRKRRYLNGNQNLQVSAIGTVRRLQALCALGYTQVELGKELGVSNRRVHFILQQTMVLPRTRDAVAKLYDRLCMTIPTDPEKLAHRHVRIHARARRAAIKQGWAPPLAWDDIDDPDETPKGLPRPGHRAPGLSQRYVMRVNVMEDVRDRGGTIFDVIRELHTNRDALHKWCTNHDLLHLYNDLASRTRLSTNGHGYQRKGTAA